MAKRGKNRPLGLKVQGNEVVIRIGINTLAFAHDRSSANNPWDEAREDYIQQWKVVDPKQFANDFVIELQSEEEDGSTKLVELFDEIFQDTVNEGSIAVKVCGEPSEG